MYKSKQTPRIFHDLTQRPVHQYPTQFVKTNFSLKKFTLSTTKYSNSISQDQTFGIIFYQMKKKKCSPVHYFYQELTLN